jgi:hypothetical protein
MTPHDELLDLARRHVTEGRRIVLRQRALVHGMKAHGRDTAEAERTLRLFEDSLLILGTFERHRKSEGPLSRLTRLARR